MVARHLVPIPIAHRPPASVRPNGTSTLIARSRQSSAVLAKELGDSLGYRENLGGIHPASFAPRLVSTESSRSRSSAHLPDMSRSEAVVMVSRPVGGILSGVSRRLGGHPSERPTSGCPGEPGRAGTHPTLGLAPGGVCRAVRVTPDAGALLPHRFTLTCASHRRAGDPPSAVCSLWHCPSGHPAWPLTSTLPFGVPTFLDSVTFSGPGRGHPADSPSPSVWPPPPHPRHCESPDLSPRTLIAAADGHMGGGDLPPGWRCSRRGGRWPHGRW